MKKHNTDQVLQEQNLERKLKLIAWKAQRARMDVLRVLHDKGTGHWGGAASAADVMSYLYYHRMHVNPADPCMADRDRFILSKGHASTMLYATLAERGYFPPEQLDSFREIDSDLQGHPCMQATAGVDMSTGALGHGISVGLGMALASVHSKRNFWTYVMVGEGCLNEGESWEGIMAAGKFKPSRLVLLVDSNKVQLDGRSEEIMPLEPLADKFRAFNWRVSPEGYDGHDLADIHRSFSWLDEASKGGSEPGPYVMIYNTVKGKGVSFMEDTHTWHGAPVDDATYTKALPELEQGLAALEAQL